ncbi:hypothetical protein SAMN04489725_102233, partial [Alicyclobacillus hesperidum]
MKHRRRHRRQATVSPLQQRRIQRRRNSFRLACACGMFTGLSVSTALLAHSAQGTHAMFFTQKQAIATFSAARDFPSYDETLAQQACMDARDANDAAQDAAAVLLRMQHLGTYDALQAQYGQMEQDARRAQNDTQSAINCENTLSTLAGEDWQDYQNVRQALNIAQAAVQHDEQEMSGSAGSAGSASQSQVAQQLQRDQAALVQLQNDEASCQRVVGWSGPADLQARASVQSASFATVSVNTSLREAKDLLNACARKQVSLSDPNSENNVATGNGNAAGNGNA